MAYPIELRERVVSARLEFNMKYAEIERLFSVHKDTVRSWVNKKKRGESLERSIGGGRPPKLCEADRWWLNRKLDDNPYLSSYELSSMFNKAHPELEVHRSSILREMKALGFSFKKNISRARA